MEKLYHFYVDYGRMGEIEGLFIADEDEVKRSIGKQVYLGEVLGKHSEVYFDLEEEMFTDYFADRDDPESKNAACVALLGTGTISGINPLDYISEDFEEEE